MNKDENTVLMSVDYHGLDEAITRHECVMSRNEMRAIMVWITKLTFGDLPSRNLVTGLGKFYYMLRDTNSAISELKRQNPGPGEGPLE